MKYLVLFSILLPFLFSPVFSQSYSISGEVFVDHNANGVKEAPDYGHPVIGLIAYEDANLNATFDPDEVLLGQALSDMRGQYSLTNLTPSGEFFTIAIASSDLAAGATSTNGPFRLAKGDYTNVNLSFQGENTTCFAFSDASDPDRLRVINRISGTDRWVGDAQGAGANIRKIETVSFNIGASEFFAINSNDLGTVDLETGRFTAKDDPIGTGGHSLHGNRLFQDVDGMAFDPFTGALWATERDRDGADVLFQINPQTGAHIENLYGLGNDYAILTDLNPGPQGFYDDIDDIAISPVDGVMYGINNQNGADDRLVIIDKSTGDFDYVGIIMNNMTPLTDIEGFGFTNDGDLMATTGNASNAPNSMFQVNLITAEASLIGAFSDGGDYEGCDCMTQKENRLSGTIFFDDNENQMQDGSESGVPHVWVYVFIDRDQNGSQSPGDILIDSVQTDMDGLYNWRTGSSQDFVVGPKPASFPPHANPYSLTTIAEQEIIFSHAFGGIHDQGNDFGIANGGVFPVEWLSFELQKVGLDVEVAFSTAQESNSDYFVIQRSIDPIDFAAATDLAALDAAGTSNTTQRYDFTDQEALRSPHAVLYYRIKQVDTDGQFAYSQVQSVQLDPPPFRVKLYTNSHGTTSVQILAVSQTQLMTVSLLDLAGREVFSSSFQGEKGKTY
ncbi:MAG: hypothetical protein AAF206_29330, partial [Bacteroidota bacterium]